MVAWAAPQEAEPAHLNIAVGVAGAGDALAIVVEAKNIGKILTAEIRNVHVGRPWRRRRGWARERLRRTIMTAVVARLRLVQIGACTNAPSVKQKKMPIAGACPTACDRTHHLCGPSIGSRSRPGWGRARCMRGTWPQ